MVHVVMYTPPFPYMRNRQCLCGSAYYDMRFTCVITGDARMDEMGNSWVRGSVMTVVYRTRYGTLTLGGFQ